MQIEYEAKFLDVDKDAIRAQLQAAGATLERPEFLQRRWVFDLPGSLNDGHAFVRVRDEGGIITMTLKKYPDPSIDHPEESEIIVDDFDTAAEIIEGIGCIRQSYQENRRELWHLDDAEITIDSWPFYETFVEVEAESEEAVRIAATNAGFDWDKALFCGVNTLFRMKYGEQVNIRTMPKLVFDMADPFV